MRMLRNVASILVVAATAGIANAGGGTAFTYQGQLPSTVISSEAGCSADLDGDGTVGATDLLALLATWGPCDDCDDCPANFDPFCTVGATDLVTLLVHWGPCP